MYNVVVKGRFSSAHFLREYKGKCENMHGHNYLVEIMITSEKLNDEGMVIDFSKLKETLKEVLLKLDHCLLNEIDFFKNINPTSEDICFYIFSQVKEKLSNRYKLHKVRVWETEEQYAEYYELI